MKRGTARGSAETPASSEAPAVVLARTVAPAEALVETHRQETLALEPARDAEVRVAEEASTAAETVPEEAPAAPSQEIPAALAPAEAPAVELVDEPEDGADEKPYAPQTAFEALPDLEARVKELFGRAQPLPWDQPVPEDDSTTPVVEPPAVTGHTRRVEVFDLVGGTNGAQAAVTEADDASLGEDPTAERDRRIVELARQGMKQGEIAQKVSASRSTVSRVVRRYEDQRPVAHDDRELANA